MRDIRIFDSTLRDGEQAPGFSMSIKEKVAMAKQLERLNVDVIEAGFAIVSPGDFTSVKTIASEIKNASVASLARAKRLDIEYAWNAVKCAADPILHVFLATSDIHMKYKLNLTREEVKAQIRDSVSFARSLCSTVEFSAEDATRSDLRFLAEVFQIAIDSGASVINVPDTVGYAVPEEMEKIITYLKEHLNLGDTIISVHCHNDLGLAVSNSLAAIKAGAGQAECALNGIGERAGNAALEEIVMNLKTRRDFYDADTKIDTTQITNSSKLLVMFTGVKVQPNKAVTGENAFAHEAGIHQHGMLKNRETYEIMTPESIGLTENKMILGKHSGRHALEEKLHQLGYTVTSSALDGIFEKFKELADAKKVVKDKDIEALVKNSVVEIPKVYKLDKYVLNSSNVLSSTCNIGLIRNETESIQGYASGSGPIEAAFNAINIASGLDLMLNDYSIEAVTGGTDAQGAVGVRISYENEIYKGYGVDVNIIEASILAYINAINNMLYERKCRECQ
ncbi:MAG: 2-isopropylmalate synthase [Clostridiales bacterium]|jgi:2-isopropylmalate synthase|nr:2-isopropylmalate synthase [Clostridiales bacterium]